MPSSGNLKILIAVTTCHNFNYDMTAINQCMVLYREGMDFKSFRPPFIRQTWWNDVPATVDKKFFYGRSKTAREPLADEVFLDVDDSYAMLPHKIKAIYQWALDHGYDYVFKCDDDTFVYVDRLLNSGFENHKWIGRYNGGHFVAGGPGYWISKDAMKIVASSAVGKAWAEDIWVSGALVSAGYQPEFDHRYVDLRRGEVDNSTVAVCECTEAKMKELYGKG